MYIIPLDSRAGIEVFELGDVTVFSVGHQSLAESVSDLSYNLVLESRIIETTLFLSLLKFAQCDVKLVRLVFLYVRSYPGRVRWVNSDISIWYTVISYFSHSGI